MCVSGASSHMRGPFLAHSLAYSLTLLGGFSSSFVLRVLVALISPFLSPLSVWSTETRNQDRPELKQRFSVFIP